MVTQDNSTWWANWGKTICILRRWMAHQLHPWELIHRGQVRKFVRWGWDGLTITQSNCKNFDIAAHLYCLFLQNVRLSPDFACIWSQSLCHYPCCHVKRLLHRMLSQLGKCFPSQFTPWRKKPNSPQTISSLKSWRNPIWFLESLLSILKSQRLKLRPNNFDGKIMAMTCICTGWTPALKPSILTSTVRAVVSFSVVVVAVEHLDLLSWLLIDSSNNCKPLSTIVKLCIVNHH